MVNRYFIYHARQPPGRVAGYPGKFFDYFFYPVDF